MTLIASAAVLSVLLQVLSFPQSTEGISCFTCEHRKNSNEQKGCENSDLKAGHTNNRYSKACEKGNDGVCVKTSVYVTGYYEERFEKGAMDKYYAALDKSSACRGVPDLTDSASGGENGTTVPSGATTPGPDGAATEAPPARRRRSTEKKCPGLPEFPPSEAQPKNPEHRTVYACGDRKAWAKAGLLDRCRYTGDGIVYQTVCTCTSDLCNGGRSARLSAAFLLLAAALLRLRAVVG